jgi:uncharacterized Zn-binding protein involved in type VI secretion
MPNVHRLGDLNDAGGSILSIPQSTVFANGILISVDGSLVSPHRPFLEPHITAKTSSGSSTVSIGGIPVNRQGDADTCGHTRVGGSDNVFVGG